MAAGRVKWFNEDKGWGFITCDNNVDVFVHHTNILGEGRRTLNQDEVVEFDIVQGRRGLQATRVKRTIPIPRAERWAPRQNPY
jgi:cold shock protein